jgi:hypothetical protein
MRAGGDGLVIALLGEITPADAHLLATLPRRGVSGVAFRLDTTTWAALPRRRAAEITSHREQAARTLDHGGWTVVTTTARESISAAWARMVSRAAVLSGGAKAASR